jgi:CopG family nickel-responsive transcriptional regulator
MAKQEHVTRFSVSLPNSLMAELDRRVNQRGYSSRSEFVRDLIRARMVEDRWEAGAEDVVGVLTIGYDHHQRGLLQKIVDLHHSQYVHILCTTHVHLDRHNCLETVIIKGRPGEIERIAGSSAGLRGVRFARLTKAATLES